MTTRSLDAPTHLTAHPLGPRSVIWWAMVGLLAIETVVFSGLIAIYFYLKLANPSWPPEGIAEPELLLPTANSLLLIASGVAVYLAGRAIQQDRRGGLLVGQIVAVVLAAIFLGVKVYEYAGYDYDWATHAYGSITFTITGLHGAHVLSVLLKGLVIIAMAARDMFRPERHLAVQVHALYWQFVVIVWIPLYFTLYLSPRL